MKKEDVLILVQLLKSMRDAVAKLENAYSERDIEKMMALKKEVLSLYDEVAKLT